MCHIRERKVCGSCGSLSIRRYQSGIYRCTRCEYETTAPPTKTLGTFQKSINTRGELSSERIDNIRRVHAKNPEYTQKKLIAFVPETYFMVHKYWKQYVTGANNDRA